MNRSFCKNFSHRPRHTVNFGLSLSSAEIKITYRSDARQKLITIYLLKAFQPVAAPQGGLGGTFPPPNPKIRQKIFKETWHKISLVYLWIEKLRQNPPPHFSRVFQSWRRQLLSTERISRKKSQKTQTIVQFPFESHLTTIVQ